jgi:hypothetical protein
VGWAVGRYRAAGLELPALEVAFHRSVSACGGNSGFASGVRIDLCTTSPSLGYLRATVLHEIAHVWLERHVSDGLRAAFIDLRGLQTWSSPDAPWGLQGVEQAAETLAWGLGDGTVEALVADDDPEELADAFELLTRSRPLNRLASGDLDREEEA